MSLNQKKGVAVIKLKVDTNKGTGLYVNADKKTGGREVIKIEIDFMWKWLKK